MYTFFIRNYPLVFSLLFHLMVIVFLSIQLPSFILKNHSAVMQNQVIVIDAVSLGEINNIKLKGKKGAINTKNVYSGLVNNSRKVENIVKTEEIVKEKKNSLQSDDESDLMINEKKKSHKSANEVSKVMKNNNDNISQEEELESILKSIQTSKSKSKTSNASDNKDGILGKGRLNYNENNPMTIRAIDAIRSKFIKCWTVPTGAKDAENLRVSVRVILSIEGKVINADIDDLYSYNRNPFFRAMADSAVRAIHKCSPLLGLPESQYQTWREIVLNFDPKDMLALP